jgi:hypothetical protein
LFLSLFSKFEGGKLPENQFSLIAGKLFLSLSLSLYGPFQTKGAVFLLSVSV